MIRAAVVGAGGYGGGELLRLLVQHPDVTLVQATSREPGQRLDAIHPGLRGLTDLVTTPSTADALDADLDVVFLALPHGASSELAGPVLARLPDARVIDLAQDFRTATEAGWVYGLPELFGAALRGARTIACPGCFATAILLATGPVLAGGWHPRHVIVDAKTGSSGAGAAPGPGTHHPTRSASFRAYRVFEHQHEHEVAAAWQRLNGNGPLPALAFVPQSAPLVRGIYACCYLTFETRPPVELREWYREFYATSPFVRVVEAPPNVLDVRGTNNADLFVRDHGDVTLVIAAIDNLVRGAAGQAVQCMNLAFGLSPDRGLRLAAVMP